MLRLDEIYRRPAELTTNSIVCLFVELRAGELEARGLEEYTPN